MFKNKQILNVNGVEVGLVSKRREDYISLTDMAKGFGGDEFIYTWMKSGTTVEFLGVWEELYNSNFKGGDFATFKMQAGLKSFHLTPKKWISATNAIGLFSKAGRYGGGTYAHKDIAFEFGSWLSPEFKLYLIKEFQRLKNDEIKAKSLNWDLSRNLARINYKIHTDAIKKRLVPEEITKRQERFIYAEESDLLNVALFGMTANEWRELNSDKDGNIRDYADARQLVVLSNLESINAVLINSGVTQSVRIKKLNEVAISQMEVLMREKVDIIVFGAAGGT